MDSANAIIQLPLEVTSKSDVNRLLREVDAVDNFIEAELIRTESEAPKVPKTSLLLEEIRLQNKLNLIDKDTRVKLKKYLESVSASAPVLHMSFSADPSTAFIKKLIGWLREEIHPLALIQVGLQPTIGAGVVVRTNNKQFDFSLRQRFYDNRDNLIRALRNRPENKDSVSPEGAKE